MVAQLPPGVAVRPSARLAWGCRRVSCRPCLGVACTGATRGLPRGPWICLSYVELSVGAGSGGCPGSLPGPPCGCFGYVLRGWLAPLPPGDCREAPGSALLCGVERWRWLGGCPGSLPRPPCCCFGFVLRGWLAPMPPGECREAPELFCWFCGWATGWPGLPPGDCREAPCCSCGLSVGAGPGGVLGPARPPSYVVRLDVMCC